MIPMFTARDGLKPFVEVREPVEPDPFGSVDELVGHLACVVGDALLERPETVDFVTGHISVWPEDSGPYRWAFT